MLYEQIVIAQKINIALTIRHFVDFCRSFIVLELIFLYICHKFYSTHPFILFDMV